jgi:hypothetical protein
VVMVPGVFELDLNRGAAPAHRNGNALRQRKVA